MVVNVERASPNKNRIARVGNHFYDMGTANKSFIQVAKDLHNLGIKNCYFMLEIYDISLVNVDPYAVDPKTGKTTLTKDQIARVINECVRNPWYYLREISRIPEQGGSGVPYKANRGNIAQAWCFLHHLDSWLCLPRQEGKTQSAVAILTWSYSFGTTQSEFLFNNKSGDDAKLNLRRVIDQIQLLPDFLKFESVTNDEGKKEKSRFSATKISSPITHNSIKVTAKATSYDRALNLARGMTTPVQFYDEVEFTDYIDTIIKNSYPAFKKAADNAIKNGAAAARIMTSTPGDLDTKAGKCSQELLDNTAEWSERLYDMTSEGINKFFEAKGDKCNGILYIEYSYTQIGRTHEWFKKMSAGMNGDTLTIRRELLLQRLHGSSLSPYDREDMEAIIELQRKPIDELWVNEYYKFDIYTPLDKRKAYIIGVDCSTGTNGDNNAITVVDPHSLEPVAEFECSFIGETRYEQLLISLIKDYLPRSVLCIERNSMGDGVIDHLLHSPISQNLYYDKNKDLMGEIMKGNETVVSLLKKEAAQKRFYGVYTSGTSRDQMFAILSRHVNEYKEKFVTVNITRDITRLVKTPSGKVAAGPGFHDDSVMSYLIAMYVRYHGNNLELFGIRIGATDEELNNTGLKRPEEIDTTLVDKSLVDAAIKEEKLLSRQNEYERMMQDAIYKSQSETYNLQKKGLIGNTIFEDTPDFVANDYMDDSSFDSVFKSFGSLNGDSKKTTQQEIDSFNPMNYFW